MSQKTKVSVRPIGDRVFAQLIEQEDKLKGGIILPGTAKKKKEIARVVAIGSGKVNKGKNIPVPVKVGDLILADKYSGQSVTIDSEEYLVLNSDDIIAKIEE